MNTKSNNFIKKLFIKVRRVELEELFMKEVELNTIFNIVADPDKNVYVIDSVKKMHEIQRIAKVFGIVKDQKTTASAISARGLVAFKMLVSNN